MAIAVGTQVHGLRGDFKRTLEGSDEAIRLGTASGFPLWNAIGKIVGGWARAQMGETDGACDRIREGLAELNAMEFRQFSSRFRILLCETQALANAVEDALATVEEALESDPDELLYRPSALRLRGELKLKRTPGGRMGFQLAERDFREAIKLAQEMGAKSLELRAVTGLARLLSDTGRRDEGRATLGEIYNWFTEGFDTLDLKDAKALLDELVA